MFRRHIIEKQCWLPQIQRNTSYDAGFFAGILGSFRYNAGAFAEVPASFRHHTEEVLETRGSFRHDAGVLAEVLASFRVKYHVPNSSQVYE